MVTRLQQHLVDAHGFGRDGAVLRGLVAATAAHEVDHEYGTRMGAPRRPQQYMHSVDDYYLSVDEDGDTSDPDEVLDADPA